VVLGAILSCPGQSSAQEAPAAEPPAEIHEHVAVTAAALTPTRETSGTAWMPAVTPMYGIHQPWHGWDLRLDGVASLQAIFEPRDRHRTGGAATRQGSSANWAMFGARRSAGAGRFGIRTMFSLEPWTIPNCGALSFLATGEVCDGDTIHDRQQAHDLFMELAVDYARPLRGGWRWQVYAGLAGEPALGPPGYPHRASALVNPIGPITHHWLDATHVTFGVVTVGVNNRRWNAEASTFNGREPDESRVDLDLGAFDSVAGRVSFLPTDRLALQVSGGRLREARSDFVFEAQDPVTRVTASAMYNRPIGARGTWATTLAYGASHARELVAGGVLDATTIGVLGETTLTFGGGRHSVFGRGEAGELPAHHLHAHEYSTEVFTIGKIQIGYVHSLPARRGLVPGVGATISMSVVPPALAPRYSGRTPTSLGFFFSVRGAGHQM
jgi:hypothetical protein